jgi:hypothetical protein
MLFTVEFCFAESGLQRSCDFLNILTVEEVIKDNTSLQAFFQTVCKWCIEASVYRSLLFRRRCRDILKTRM